MKYILLAAVALALGCSEQEMPFATNDAHSPQHSVEQVAPDPCTNYSTAECQGVYLGHGGSSWTQCVDIMGWGDADYDGVDDACESEVAKGFAPTLMINTADSDSTRESYFAVKKSSLGGRTLDILYMIGYHHDGGLVGGTFNGYGKHDGDSEFVLVTVMFDPTYGRWKLMSAEYSAHWNTLLDKTETYAWQDLYYYDAGTFNYGFWRRNPVVYVAKDKHANYDTSVHCNSAEEFEPCAGQLAISRVVIPETGANVGSAEWPMVDCTTSRDPSTYHGTECFWDTAWQSFRGWTGGQQGSAPAPYWQVLFAHGW